VLRAVGVLGRVVDLWLVVLTEGVLRLAGVQIGATVVGPLVVESLVEVVDPLVAEVQVVTEVAGHLVKVVEVVGPFVGRA